MIPVGVLGRILAGQEKGRYVRVQDDRDRTGGFLILTGADRDLQMSGADNWVDGNAALVRFFEESGWLIEWEDETALEE